ncbi:MAG: tetratricopeptide repeat protein, partial [Caldilineaceae bacterium]|nr:tetratricopeptide repeat protein [Caldilineaceae bacterium]
LAVTATADDATQIEQATAALRDLNQQWLPRLPLLANLLGLPIADNELTAAFDARLRQEALTSLVVEATLASARRSPLLLLLEDVHWMDEASQALVLALARVVGAAPLLLVTVQRPLRTAEGFLAALAATADAVHLRLGDLDQAAAAELASRRLAGAVDNLTADFIHAQAQGNPFFVEELTDNLREGGGLQPSNVGWTLAPALFGALRAARCVEQRAGEWRLIADAPLSALQLGAPPSLHALILARLDRLPESARLTLKVASVIGRVFEDDLLAAAHPSRPDAAALAGQVELFQQREFARLEHSAHQRVYIFKHNITQEVVYDTLLEQQQQELHLAVAQALEKLRPAAVERLAHHYQHSDVGLPAVRGKSLHFLELAARRAQHDFANETALRYFRAALALEERSAWRVEEARLLHILGERAEEAAVLARLESLPDAPQPATAFLRADFCEATNAYAEGRAALQQVLALAAIAGDSQGEVQALAQLGQLALRQGDLAQAQAWYSQAAAGLGDAELPTAAAGDVAYGLGVVNRQQTDFAAAQAHFSQALRCYAAAGRRADEAKTYTALGTVAFFRKDNATALDLFRQALTIRRDIGDRQGEGSSLLNIAQALGATGDFSQAQALLRTALAIQQAIGNRWWENRVWNELGVLALLVGDWAAARANLERALALSSAIGDETADLITLINLALAARGEGRQTDAETQLRQCLAMAERQADLEGEANCQTELGLLYADAGAWAAAAACAASALGTYLALEMAEYAVTNRSTLALVDLHDGRLADALDQAALVEPLVRASGGEGLDYPQRDCWVCAQVWRAAGRTAAADDILAFGREIIARRAARISGPEMRRQFLRAAPYNRLYA